MKQVKVVILMIFVCMSASCQFAYSQPRTHVKQITDKDGRINFIYYKDDVIFKTISTFDGLRDGQTVELLIDTISEEYSRIVSYYEKGILKEEEFYIKDSILTDRYIYERGIMKYSAKLVEIDNEGNLHYIEKKFSNCSFMLYNLINNQIIDSVEVHR